MKFDFEAFGKKCKYNLSFSDYRNMSIRQIAFEWNISASTLSRLFRGHKCDVNTVVTAAFFLDITIDDYII